MLDWHAQCNIKTVQNPTNITNLCLTLLLMREVADAKPVEEECQNQLCSYRFAHIFMKMEILKYLIFFFCFWVLILRQKLMLNEETCIKFSDSKNKNNKSWFFFLWNNRFGVFQLVLGKVTRQQQVLLRCSSNSYVHHTYTYCYGTNPK